MFSSLFVYGSVSLSSIIYRPLCLILIVCVCVFVFFFCYLFRFCTDFISFVFFLFHLKIRGDGYTYTTMDLKSICIADDTNIDRIFFFLLWALLLLWISLLTFQAFLCLFFPCIFPKIFASIKVSYIVIVSFFCCYLFYVVCFFFSFVIFFFDFVLADECEILVSFLFHKWDTIDHFLRVYNNVSCEI